MAGRIAMEGEPIGEEALLGMEARYGHFTSMQVADRRVRGLELHVKRLERAGVELFGAGPGRAEVLASIKAALGGERDASVRVYYVEVAGRPRVIATAAAPHPPLPSPLRVTPVVYQRYLPHIKQASGFQQPHILRTVNRAGFDEALLTTEDGLISEGAITNVGGFAGGRLVWPDAPMLHGVTMQLLERMEVPQERRPLRVPDLAEFDLVFLCNSWGVMPVGEVDGMKLRRDAELEARLLGFYEGIAGDPVD
ncbi:aminotransferase class IV [Nonomuraea sp. NPDC004580]|uniref:aminotransferase class IV n=1 Tax=Nonomuraea sp. NPDC004580 TaxID=3154552 RepID=UPI0033A4E98C